MEQGILPSRKELLTRIELVCDLDSSLISVTGDAGIGKSALLEFFIEHHCRDIKKCFFGAEPNTESYQVRENILSQLLPGCTYDSHLSLAQNIAALAPDQSFKGIFILDNAQYIADEVFYDLIDLMDDGRYQFSVIYAQARDESRQADLNARKALIEIHPEPLDVAESKLLLQFYYGDSLAQDKSQIKQFIIDSEGVPANLLMWQQQSGKDGGQKKSNKKTIKKERRDTNKVSSAESSDLDALVGELASGSAKAKKSNNSKLLVILAGGLLLTVVAVAAWYFMPPSQQSIKDELRAQLRAKVEQQNQAAQNNSKNSETNSSKEALSQEVKSDVQGSDVINSQTAQKKQSENQAVEESEKVKLDELLAQPWDDEREIKPEHKFDSPEDKNAKDPRVIEVIKVGQAQQGQREIETAQSSSLASELSTNESSEESNQASETAISSQSNSNEANLSEAIQQSTLTTKNSDKLMDNEWFLAQAPTGAMVQLAGLSEKRVLDSYLQRHKLQESARVYQSKRNGKPWFVVTIGPYANMNDAREAIGQLSQALQDTRPWAKSIQAIQSELVNANK